MVAGLSVSYLIANHLSILFLKFEAETLNSIQFNILYPRRIKQQTLRHNIGSGRVVYGELYKMRVKKVNSNKPIA